MEWYISNINDFSTEDCIKYLEFLSKYKKRQLLRCKNYECIKETIVGEIVAKKSIAKFLNINFYDIEFDIGINGKPYVNNLNIYFNISHSNGLVVCAVDHNPIGIDIEKIKPINLSIMNYFFKKNEKNYVLNGPTLDFTKNNEYNVFCRFFEIWTAKEACLKFSGLRISDFKNIYIKNIKLYSINQEYIVAIRTIQ